MELQYSRWPNQKSTYCRALGIPIVLMIFFHANFSGDSSPTLPPSNPRQPLSTSVAWLWAVPSWIPFSSAGWHAALLRHFALVVTDFGLFCLGFTWFYTYYVYIEVARRAVFEIHKRSHLRPSVYLYYTKISPDFGVILAPDMCLDNVRHKCVTWYYFVWLCGIWHTHKSRKKKNIMIKTGGFWR